MLTPFGVPLKLNVIGAVPVAVTWNVPPAPLVTVVLFAEVIVGATGAGSTVRVKFCAASGLIPLVAVMVKAYVFATTDAAIVINPLAPFMLTPVGAPLRLKVIGVVPVAVTWNVPPVPLITVVLFAEVIVGATGAGSTVRVKLCVASGLIPLVAVIVKAYVFAATDAAIVINPVEPFMLTPVGAPLKLKVIGVVPLAVTWNVPPVPLVTVVLFAEVIVGATGAGFTVRVKL